MIFSNPYLLWATLGIVVPVAIHLWNRKKVVTLKIGSTKLLRKSEPRHTGTLRPNEWWLLLLRMLTIVLLALVLAGPHWTKPIKNIPITYLVEPALIESEKMGKLLDTIAPEGTRVLADGFPQITEYEGKASDGRPPNYWQLVQEMPNLGSDSIVVFTNASVTGIKGMRPHAANTISFVTLHEASTVKRTLEARRLDDGTELLMMVGDGKRLGFETKKIPFDNEEIMINTTGDSVMLTGRRLPLQRNDSLRLLLVYEDSLWQEMRYISAAYRAISKFLDRDIHVRTVKELDSIDIDTYDFSIWLGKNPITRDDLSYLTYRPDELADELIVPGERNNEYRLTERLNSENMVSGYLAETLLSLLPLHQGLAAEVASYDSRSLDPDAFKPETGAMALASKSMEQMDISTWLLGVLALIMATERILAKYRKQ